MNAAARNNRSVLTNRPEESPRTVWRVGILETTHYLTARHMAKTASLSVATNLQVSRRGSDWQTKEVWANGLQTQYVAGL